MLNKEHNLVCFHHFATHTCITVLCHTTYNQLLECDVILIQIKINTIATKFRTKVVIVIFIKKSHQNNKGRGGGDKVKVDHDFVSFRVFVLKA